MKFPALGFGLSWDNYYRNLDNESGDKSLCLLRSNYDNNSNVGFSFFLSKKDRQWQELKHLHLKNRVLIEGHHFLVLKCKTAFSNIIPCGWMKSCNRNWHINSSFIYIIKVKLAVLSYTILLDTSITWILLGCSSC